MFQRNVIVLFHNDKRSPASVAASVALWAVQSLRRWQIEARVCEIRERQN